MTRDRRHFLQCLAAGGCAACLAEMTIDLSLAQDPASGAGMIEPTVGDLPMRPARWWKAIDGGRVECELCPQACRVADRERGECGVRENRGGEYYTLVHSRACSLHLDPIEKKPFYHVLPGQAALSVAAPGCNIECKFCQNWQIAQVRPEQVETVELPPEHLVRLARRHGAPTIACTYSEPVVWAEYVHDIARAGNKQGVRTLLVSNGYINPGPMAEIIEDLAAVKIDLKAFTREFYRETCSGELQPVLDTLELLRKKKVWTEIVVLVIPTLNDSDQELERLTGFVAKQLGADVPVHFTRFHPSYRLQNLPPTPVRTLERAREIGLEQGLHFVYVGNVPGHPGNHTYCPSCGKLLIRRIGYKVLATGLKDGHCPACKTLVPGVWS